MKRKIALITMAAVMALSVTACGGGSDSGKSASNNSSAQGSYRWPRNKSEVRNLTWREFDWLMSGLDIEQPKAIKST